MYIGAVYNLIFYILVTIASIIQFNRYKNLQKCNGETSQTQSSCLVIAIIITLFIGLRPVEFTGVSGFGDSINYIHTYLLLENRWFEFDFEAPNKIWDNLFAFCASNSYGISNIFLFSDILYFGGTYWACKKFFPKDYGAAFIAFLGAFSTYSYSCNGIKAGIAGAIFLLALAYRKRIILSVALVLISWGFHHSMQLPVAAYLLASFYKNSKVYFAVWVLCIFIALLHISYFQNWFASMSDEGGSKYLTEDASDWGGISGFRLDFILYSAMPVLVAYIAMYKKRIKLSAGYRFILNIYMITNSVWMLCMYAQFTNRIAYLSWFMYPIVLIYPFLKEDWGSNRYKVFAQVMAYQLLFTLFMNFVFYRL